LSFFKLDITYVVSRLSRYTKCLNQEHCDALARLMSYLRGSMVMPLNIMDSQCTRKV